MGLYLLKLLRLMFTRRPCWKGAAAGWMVGRGVRGSDKEECMDNI